VNDNHSANERPTTPTGPPAADADQETVPPAEATAGDEDVETEGGETDQMKETKEPADKNSVDEDILPYWLYPD
jgi:hypothetical protein